MKAHREYFDVNQAFHGGPGYVYLVKDVPIYCTQTDRRMKELESWGPSAMSWKARLDYLNAYRGVLMMPWFDAFYGVPFDTLDNLFRDTKKIYNRQEYRPLLESWVADTEKYLLSQGAKYATDGGGGLTRVQQLEMLREWISRLRKDLQ